MKIYACSGIGDNGTYDYWLDNTNTATNTQAVNTILADINLKYADVRYMNMAPEYVKQNLDAIDCLSVSLFYAQEYKDNTTALVHAGQVIATMVKAGLFDFDSLDNEERDRNLDVLFTEVEEAMHADLVIDPDMDFLNWWDEKVVARNKVGLSEHDQKVLTTPLPKEKVQGIGLADGYFDDPDIGKYLSDSGSAFLYMFYTDEQIENMTPSVKRAVKTRLKYQKQIYNYCKHVFVAMYGSEEEMKKVIRTNIVKNYQRQPEEVCTDLATNARSPEELGIGLVWTVADIIALIGLLLTFLLAVVKIICEYVARTKEAKYKAMQKDAEDWAVADPEDYKGTSAYKQYIEQLKKGSVKAWGGLVAAAVGIYLLFFSKK